MNWFLPLCTDHPGGVRRLLGLIGPTWRYSPVRRIVQAICLVLFLWLFFYVCWPYTAQPNPKGDAWASHYADNMRAKEWIEVEAFLDLDPLVGVSTALAARTWAPCLAWAAGLLRVRVPAGHAD